MEKTYQFVKKVLVALGLLVVCSQAGFAQKLQLQELMNLRTKSIEDIRATLESKGWIYDGQCGGQGEMPRHCFKIGDGKSTSLAAVLYVEGNTPNDQALEYSVFRKGPISQVQGSLRAAAMKLLRQEAIAPDVKVRIYEKSGNVLQVRGGLDKQYYSVKVQEKPAYERMQASLGK